MTLMETLIALALSLVVVTSMVSLMGNSMGSTTTIIQMTQLNNELRNVMSMVSRDVRRANYNPYAYYCYANSDCGISGGYTAQTDDLITPAFNSIEDACLLYWLEREDPTGDTSGGNIGGGGFRLNQSAHNPSRGVVEMWVGNETQPPPNDCAGNNWMPVTDPDFVDITDFSAEDLPGSFTGSITAEGTTIQQRTRQVVLQIEGQLVRDASVQRRIEDVIRVRNDHILVL